MTLNRYWVLASHYQFFVHDASLEPVDLAPEYSDEETRRGWARTEHALVQFASSHLWSIRVDIGVVDANPSVEGSDRLVAHTLELPTGHLQVTDPVGADPAAQLRVEPGMWSLYVREFNRGAETEDELSPEERILRDDLERYEILLVRGPCERDGLIAGPEYLW